MYIFLIFLNILIYFSALYKWVFTDFNTNVGLLLVLFLNFALWELFIMIYTHEKESASPSFIRLYYVRYYLKQVLNIILNLIYKLIVKSREIKTRNNRINRDEYTEYNEIYIKPLFNNFNRNNNIEMMYNLDDEVDKITYWRFRNDEMCKLARKYPRKNDSKLDFFKLDDTAMTRFIELLSPLTLNLFKKTSKDIYYQAFNLRGIEVSTLLFYSPSRSSIKHYITAYKLK